MFAKFASKVQGAGGRGERKYELNEVLAILDMANEEMSKEDISKLTGRSKDSLNYKIFEGQTTIKGKTNVRSIKRFWFQDPKVKNSPQVDTIVALRALYSHFGVDTAKMSDEELQADVQGRIGAYHDALEGVAAPAV